MTRLARAFLGLTALAPVGQVRAQFWLPLILASCAGSAHRPLSPTPRAATSGQAEGGSLDPTPAVDAFVMVHGLRMHYLRRGHGPALVLLHGGLTSAEACWSRTALPFFAAQFDVIAPDQLGQGRTNDDLTHPMGYHAMAEDTVELLGQLGVTRAVFVGWSDGGILALDIAMHHPVLATKIVASSANSDPGGAAPDVVAMFKTVPADSPLLKEARDAHARLSPDGPSHWPVLFERMRTLYMTEPQWTTADLATIAAPTLIIAGDHDAIRTEHTVQIAASIPGAELAILPNAGHGVPLDDPARWDAVILRFLNEPAGR